MFELIASVVGWIWNGLQAISAAIVYGLVAAFHFIVAFGRMIWDAAKFTYQNILKPVGIWLDKIYKRAVDLYDHYVKPVIDWLKKITALARKIYFTVLAPVLAVIDGMQKTLKLLELLHVEWAADVDKALAELERKLSLPLQLTIEFVNGLINRVESYVLTAENLFQRVTHLNTLRRDIAAVQNIQWNSMLRNMRELASKPIPKPQRMMAADDHLQVMENVFNGAAANESIVDADAALAMMEAMYYGQPLPENAAQ